MLGARAHNQPAVTVHLAADRGIVVDRRSEAPELLRVRARPGAAPQVSLSNTFHITTVYVAQNELERSKARDVESAARTPSRFNADMLAITDVDDDVMARYIVWDLRLQSIE
jgi:hypothetical protein